MKNILLLCVFHLVFWCKAQLSVSTGVFSNADCNGNGASVFVNINNGSGDYDVSVDGNVYFFAQASDVYSVVGGGSYPQPVAVEVYDLNTGESYSEMLFVNIVRPSSTSFGYSYYTNCSCVNSFDISTEIIDGVGPYMINYFDDQGNFFNVTTPLTLCPGTYTAFVTDANGCSVFTHNTAGVPSSEWNILVDSVFSTFKSLTICSTDSVFLQNNYQNTQGNYIDTLSSIGGCDSIINTFLQINTLNLSISQSGITLFANETANSYQWIDCLNSIPIFGATSQSFTPTFNGSYAVILTNNFCSDTTFCYVLNNVGLKSTDSFSKDVHIYPNPTKNQLNIKINNPTTTTSVQMFSASGVLLYSNTFLNNEEISLNVTEYSSGVYFVKLLSNDLIFSYKWVKEDN